MPIFDACRFRLCVVVVRLRLWSHCGGREILFQRVCVGEGVGKGRGSTSDFGD